LLPRSNALKTKAIRYFQTDRTLTRIVSPPLLDKLLSMINQNMVSDEENWNMFQSNFDRIHENFFRNLKEKFPDLTSGDLRLCALLRLNLPTKEIAKLMNISVRGVDAARYRLRKKLGLPPESSLTDFMIAFK
ncbi:helix-turn-helix transcriptional regulator, partial [Bacteroides fragilis]|uniref:helix-turn-helix transcriptional regulator n=1 Tax=Bacteroides fragilis TaxID=817 RepID=UPI0022C36CF3|nr:hypothetical protein [Bacteroides fragilis]